MDCMKIMATVAAGGLNQLNQDTPSTSSSTGLNMMNVPQSQLNQNLNPFAPPATTVQNDNTPVQNTNATDFAEEADLLDSEPDDIRQDNELNELLDLSIKDKDDMNE